MAKIELDTNVTNPNNALLPYNENFRKIEEALQDRVLYRDNPEGEPNQLETGIDANENRIYNLPLPIGQSEAATKGYVDQYADLRFDELLALLMPFVDQAEQSSISADASAQLAANSAQQAANSAAQIDQALVDAANYADAAQGWSEVSQDAAVSSQFSANSSASSASQAAIYSSLGLGGAVAFDFGTVADPIIIFPTDFGSLI